MSDEPETSIPPTEWDVLEVLWGTGRATAPEVASALARRRGWAYSTVKTILDRMVKKGLVEGRRVGNVWEYRAVVGQDEARRGAWRRFVDIVFDGAMAPALRFLATDARLTRKQRKDLSRLLAGDDEEDGHA